MEKHHLSIKDSATSFLISFLLCQLSVVLVSFIILAIGSMLKISNIENFSLTCVGNLILSSTMYLVMFILFKIFTKNKDNKITTKTKFNKVITYIVIAILCFFLLYPIVNSFDYLLEALNFKLNQPKFNFNITNYFICLIPMVILPAICEELLFRGLIFKGLQKHGKTFSTLLTSIMFAIYHMSIQQTIYPLLFGFLLTLVMYKENNIVYCIAMHFTNNFIALTFMFLKVNLFTPKIWYFVLAVIIAIIFIILLILFAISIKNTQNKEKINNSYLFLFIFVLIIMFILWIISNIYR